MPKSKKRQTIADIKGHSLLDLDPATLNTAVIVGSLFVGVVALLVAVQAGIGSTPPAQHRPVVAGVQRSADPFAQELPEWPGELVEHGIPEFTGGTLSRGGIENTLDGQTLWTLLFIDVTKQDLNEYAGKVIDQGWIVISDSDVADGYITGSFEDKNFQVTLNGTNAVFTVHVTN